MSRIGMMGGTFNPIHNGHIAIAEKALNQFNLDKIIFITAGKMPHKKNEGVLNANIRHKMVCKAIKYNPRFETSDYEINKQTPSYTFETLRYFKKQSKDNELYLIIGGDSFHNITEWYRPRAIMELCTFLVYERKGYDYEQDFERLKKDYYFHSELIKADNIDISSSEIREKISKGEDVSNLLPPKVYRFILRNNLYLHDEGNFKKRMERRLGNKRYMHSVGVMIKAEQLAKKYGVDVDKAKVAAILHDCAKEIPQKEMYAKCRDYDVELDEYERKNPSLIHAKLGAKIAEIEFGITDKEVLEAIKWHTVGCVGMSDLAKVIYVADMLEPGRKFAGIRRLKAIADKDLNMAVLECTKATVEFNLAKGVTIHPNAYALIDWLDERRK